MVYLLLPRGPLQQNLGSRPTKLTAGATAAFCVRRVETAHDATHNNKKTVISRTKTRKRSFHTTTRRLFVQHHKVVHRRGATGTIGAAATGAAVTGAAATGAAVTAPEATLQSRSTDHE